jgi:hypothetical protein
MRPIRAPGPDEPHGPAPRAPGDLPSLDEIPDPIAPGGVRQPRLPPQRAPSPDRTTLARRRLAAVSISTAWLAAHLAIYGIRQDFSRLPLGYVLAQVLLPVVVGLSCLIISLAPGRLGLGLGVGLASTAALLGPLSFLAAAVLVPAPYTASGSAAVWLGSFVCLGITLSWALVPLIAAAWTLRRAFPAGAAWRSALVGAAIGTFSGAAINLHCRSIHPGHMALGHSVPVALLALCGGVLLVRWLKA